jgi:leader peptidase (prepilin peptidase)/N-methyltransferase
MFFSDTSMIWMDAAVGAIFGAVIGSFLATLFLRWPAGLGVAGGRSRCDGCGTVLAVHSLVPLLSFAWQRGHCVSCGARIDPVHPLMELAAAAIGGLAGAMFAGEPAVAVAGAVFGWQLLLLGALDLGHRWLPDRLNLILAATGLGFAALDGWLMLRDALAGMMAGYLTLELVRRLYRRLRGREGLGGGDPKLFGAIGAWLGWVWLPWALVCASLAGLGVAAMLALADRSLPSNLRHPLGTLLALAAWPIWIFARQG